MLSGFATPNGTADYAARFPSHQGNEFFREAQGLTVSSVGIGSYLGAMDEETDRSYAGAMRLAIESGINFIDTSLNYRHQRSERAIGEALRQAGVPRDQLVICTKAGYLVPDALPVGLLPAAEVAGSMHCMAPVFLEDQLERSRSNLAIETVDVFYLHNPETQLRFTDSATFVHRIRSAFEKLETMVSDGRIRFYGTATWDGYRRNGMADALSLVKIAQIAQEIAGEGHHFRFIQLPFNLAMTEAYGQKAEVLNGERMSVLDASGRLGISTIASASLLQARLTRELPEQLVEALPGPHNDAGRAIQFTRSAPGIAVALVGMSKASHVIENLAAAGYPPQPASGFGELFG